LHNWLTKELIEPVSPKHIYDRFLGLAAARQPQLQDGDSGVAESLMSDIDADATRYERIDRPAGTVASTYLA
jgi:hypothetical protein